MYNKPMDFFKNAEPRLRAYVIFPGDVFKGKEIEIYAGVYTGNTPVKPLFSDYSYANATTKYQHLDAYKEMPKTLWLSPKPESGQEIVDLGNGKWKDEYLNVTDVQLFVSYSNTVGYRARDDRWSNKIEYSGDSFDALFGEPVEISSIGNIPSGRKVFIRAAARINYDTPVGSGVRRWNYSEPVEVLIP